MVDDIIQILAVRLATVRATAADVSGVVLEINENEYKRLRAYMPGPWGTFTAPGPFVAAASGTERFLGVPVKVNWGAASEERRREQRAAVEELIAIAAGLES